MLATIKFSKKMFKSFTLAAISATGGYFIGASLNSQHTFVNEIIDRHMQYLQNPKVGHKETLITWNKLICPWYCNWVLVNQFKRDAGGVKQNYNKDAKTFTLCHYRDFGRSTYVDVVCRLTVDYRYKSIKCESHAELESKQSKADRIRSMRNKLCRSNKIN